MPTPTPTILARPASQQVRQPLRLTVRRRPTLLRHPLPRRRHRHRRQAVPQARTAADLHSPALVLK